MHRCLALLPLCTCVCPGADWPQWRGPQGLGVSSETDLPLEWNATKNIAWKTVIQGRGHSSPVVWGKRVFLTTAVEGDAIAGAKAPKHIMEGQEFRHPDAMGADRSQKLIVLCLDRDSGRVLWQRTVYEGAVYDDRHRKGSYASPTPAIDGRAVYAYFGSPGLYALDFEGNLLWKYSPGNLGTFGMGVATSPVPAGGRLFLQCDSEDGKGSFLTALDSASGKVLWRAPREVEVSWSTPLLAGGGAGSDLIAGGNQAIIAYDAATGKERWRAKGLESNSIPSTVAGDGMIYVTAGYPKKIAYAFRAGGDGEPVWQYAKGTAYVPSPIYYEGYLYLMTDKGLLTCLDGKTGDVKYEGGRPHVPATFTASPVAFGGKILITSEDGDTFVIRAGPKHEVLGTNSLGEPVYASPALSNGSVFLRGERHLYCIRE